MLKYIKWHHSKLCTFLYFRMDFGPLQYKPIVSSGIEGVDSMFCYVSLFFFSWFVCLLIAVVEVTRKLIPHLKGKVCHFLYLHLQIHTRLKVSFMKGEGL